MKCSVCEEDEAKYKCPRCTVRYCCVSCFRKHKDTTGCEGTRKRARDSVRAAPADRAASGDTPSTAATTTGDKSPVNEGTAPSAGPGSAEEEFDVDEMKCRVTAAQLARFSGDAEIRRQLRDSNLQRVVREIDSAPNRFKSLETRIHRDADFAAFVDRVLISIGAARRRDDGEVEFVG